MYSEGGIGKKEMNCTSLDDLCKADVFKKEDKLSKVMVSFFYFYSYFWYWFDRLIKPD